MIQTQSPGCRQWVRASGEEVIPGCYERRNVCWLERGGVRGTRNQKVERQRYHIHNRNPESSRSKRAPRPEAPAADGEPQAAALQRSPVTGPTPSRQRSQARSKFSRSLSARGSARTTLQVQRVMNMDHGRTQRGSIHRHFITRRVAGRTGRSPLALLSTVPLQVG